MRRVLGFVVLSAALLGAPAASAAPPPGHGGGPACADIVAAGGIFVTQAGPEPSTIEPKLVMAADTCKAFTYTVYVLDESGTVVLASEAVRGTGAFDFVKFDEAALGEVEAVCVYFTTGVGHHEFDRAPATGCIELAVTDEPVDYEWFP